MKPQAQLCAFDLIELDGVDLRREPLETRKATLASLLRRCRPGLSYTDHVFGDGLEIFRPRLQDGPGRHRVEARGRPIVQGGRSTGEDQEPR